MTKISYAVLYQQAFVPNVGQFGPTLVDGAPQGGKPVSMTLESGILSVFISDKTGAQVRVDFPETAYQLTVEKK